MSTQSPQPAKKGLHSEILKAGNKSSQNDPSFEELASSLDAKATSHNMAAFHRGMDLSRRSHVKDILRQHVNDPGMVDQMNLAVDHMTTPKLFEVLTADAQQRQLRSNSLEAQKAEAEVAGKEIANVAAAKSLELRDTQKDLERTKLGTAQEEQMIAEGYDPGIHPTGLTTLAQSDFASSLGLEDLKTVDDRNRGNIAGLFDRASTIMAGGLAGRDPEGGALAKSQEFERLLVDIARLTGQDPAKVASEVGRKSMLKTRMFIDADTSFWNRRRQSTRMMASTDFLSKFTMMTGAEFSRNMRSYESKLKQMRKSGGPSMVDLQQHDIGVSQVTQRLLLPSSTGGYASAFTTGVDSTRGFQLPSGNRWSFTGEYQQVAGQVATSIPEANRLDQQKRQIVSNFLTELMETQNFTQESVKQILKEAVDQAGKLTAEILPEAKGSSKAAVPHSMGMLTQAAAYQEYLSLVQEMLPTVAAKQGFRKEAQLRQESLRRHLNESEFIKKIEKKYGKGVPVTNPRFRQSLRHLR